MRPFSGLRVIDATHVIAGPFSTYLLTTLGAEVIKLEPPQDPDQTRVQGPDVKSKRKKMGTWYLSQSADKKCVTADLRTEEGREILRRLIKTADILVENYRPGAFAALGFTEAAVFDLNPKIVFCSVSAYGQTGPRASHTGYDMVMQASSGLMAMTGSTQTGPVKIGAPVIDYATGMSAAFAMSSALFQREKTGQGQRIDVAMFDVALTLMSLFVTTHSASGHEPMQVGNRGPYPTTGCYATKQGLLMIGASNHRQQKRLWKLLGHPEMIKEGELALTADREPEFQLLTSMMLERTAAQWEAYFQANHVPASEVRTMVEALQDPQLLHRRAFKEIQQFDGGSPVACGLAPFLFGHDGPDVDRAPMPLGADNDSVLHALGFDDAQVQGMRERGVI